ncbi:MAG: CDP-diacylglycerol--glycerol-3-phosphate 3-phosphatidyltransferase [Actinobacteria bacterium]|nr:CDP-diacylglycerol--glycerol-3-phosphate 3-phosphatidyltransferase [Actinomycetota bacterium]
MPNLANRITITRILLIPVFMFFILLKSIQPVGSYIAAFIFTIAAITDSVDGYIARVQNKITLFGQFLDPVADKLLISAALVSLVDLNYLSGWVAMIIIAREFTVSGLRLVAMGENKIIEVSALGKIKTIFQVIAIIVYILKPFFYVKNVSIADGLMFIAVLLTVISGIDYLIKARHIILPEG